jgi:hypothetical protein
MAKIDEAMLKRVTVNGLTCIVPEEIASEIKRLENELEKERAAHQKDLVSLTDDVNKQAEKIMANLFYDADTDDGVMKHNINHYTRINDRGEVVYEYRHDVKNRILRGLMGKTERIIIDYER